MKGDYLWSRSREGWEKGEPTYIHPIEPKEKNSIVIQRSGKKGRGEFCNYNSKASSFLTLIRNY